MSDSYRLPATVVSSGKKSCSVKEIICQGEKIFPSWAYLLGEYEWRSLGEVLEEERYLFSGLWCDGERILALFRWRSGEVLMAVHVPEGPRYPALSTTVPAALPFERVIRDLYGFEAMGAEDMRPLINRGAWPVSWPLALRPGLAGCEEDDFEVRLSSDDDREFLLISGPASGASEASALFRQSVSDLKVSGSETIRGFTHRGIAARMMGTSLEEAVVLAGRIAASSVVAHQWTFCAAVEQISGFQISESALLVRAVFAEIERILSHFRILARVARYADAGLPAQRMSEAREAVLQVLSECMGRRSLMDMVVLGGVNIPLPDLEEDADRIGIIHDLAKNIAELVDESLFVLRPLWQSYPGLLVRLRGLGPVCSEDVMMGGVTGPVARASGLGRDLRSQASPWVNAGMQVQSQREGDVIARCRQLFAECQESARLLNLFAERLTHVSADVPLRHIFHPENGWGHAVTEGPSGVVEVVLHLKEGRPASVMMRDPSVELIPLADRALKGVMPEDIAAVRNSFGFSISAADM
ncbi:MAG: hypothetical protein LKH33_03545 [Acetobacter sp.]|jgi:Ni,Fe-hydrogenase III large subunit|nr:hypothetical protein [Acetobacter sp.]MCH4060977.1 hypothetical protein [Acetobacter sp.]MCH4087917.1 hypothetical protein [Acetobacter sp.]MCI1293467.1 hypothetical protein [Acetobacter sp.]MCI1319751.1 hypothetical protein [Acetobacter sp.]